MLFHCIPEYERVQTLTLKTEPVTDNKSCIISDIGIIPKGSKLLRTEATKGERFSVSLVYSVTCLNL